MPLLCARTLLPLVRSRPPGHWRDTTRNARFVLDPRPLPDPRTPPRSCSPATWRRSARRSSATSPPGRASPQRDFPWERVQTVSYRDETGRELLDLPGRPLPPADTKLPPRFLGNWDQPLLAYADRDRIIPPEVQPLKLTLSGDTTLTVDGRVVASWTMDGPKLTHHAARRLPARRASRRRRCAPRASARPSTTATRSRGRRRPPAPGPRRDGPPLRRAAGHRHARPHRARLGGPLHPLVQARVRRDAAPLPAAAPDRARRRRCCARPTSP